MKHIILIFFMGLNTVVFGQSDFETTIFIQANTNWSNNHNSPIPYDEVFYEEVFYNSYDISLAFEKALNETPTYRINNNFNLGFQTLWKNGSFRFGNEIFITHQSFSAQQKASVQSNTTGLTTNQTVQLAYAASELRTGILVRIGVGNQHFNVLARIGLTVGFDKVHKPTLDYTGSYNSESRTFAGETNNFIYTDLSPIFGLEANYSLSKRFTLGIVYQGYWVSMHRGNSWIPTLFDWSTIYQNQCGLKLGVNLFTEK